MVSAQERLTRTFTRSSHTYTRTERTEISKTRGGETKREVRVEESTQHGGGQASPFRDVFGDFLGRESLSSFAGITAARPEGERGDYSPARSSFFIYILCGSFGLIFVCVSVYSVSLLVPYGRCTSIHQVH